MPLIYDKKNVRDAAEYLFELYGDSAPTKDEIENNLRLGYCTWEQEPIVQGGICYYYLVSSEDPSLTVGYCFVTPTFEYMTDPVEFSPDAYLGKELLNEVDGQGH